MKKGALLLTISIATLGAQDRSTGRSMTMTDRGIVATSHVLASQAGARILAQGGTAADAAIAANSVLNVVEPMACGPGGDLFVLYWEAKTGKLHGLNSSGWAPKGMTRDFLVSKGLKEMPQSGIHTVTVPGAVEGWRSVHERFGKLAWKELFADAIRYAGEGHPVHEIIAGFWPSARLKVTPEAQRVFLPEGRAPKTGELFKNPGMARLFRTIADRGADGYYRGDVAKAILAASAKLGGSMAAEDLAEFRAEWVEPISTTYRGYKVYEIPPNGQGMAALIMLNLMEQTPAAKEGPASIGEMHKKIEAMKLAYADVWRYNADPRFAKVPVRGLLDKAYAAERAKLIDPARANCAVEAGKPSLGDTTYFSVVDREGNIASWIQSLYSGWGSGVVVEEYGFALQNRGAGFTMDAAHPNVVAGRKRPFHTIIPAFLEYGDIRMGFGIMGGPNQPLAHAQFVSHLADYGMNIQEALESPRFTKPSPTGCAAEIENRVPKETIDGLTAKGHQLKVRGAYSTSMGRGAAVVFNLKTRLKQGAADPRSDGWAAPEP